VWSSIVFRAKTAVGQRLRLAMGVDRFTKSWNSKMEAELRKIKVQSDQWRKAAEVAAAMLSARNNGNFMERTGSLDKITDLQG
jgi:hypothetical protein